MATVAILFYTKSSINLIFTVLIVCLQVNGVIFQIFTKQALKNKNKHPFVKEGVSKHIHIHERVLRNTDVLRNTNTDRGTDATTLTTCTNTALRSKVATDEADVCLTHKGIYFPCGTVRFSCVFLK